MKEKAVGVAKAEIASLKVMLKRLGPVVDCADCGPRFPRPPPICAETCNWASDADCNDCSPGSEFRPAPGRARQVDRT